MRDGKYALGDDYDVTMHAHCRGEHEWVSYLHNIERCLRCLTMRRLPCQCERCLMTREEWQENRLIQLRALED